MTDFSAIPSRQDAINLRLEQWARWVRVTPKAWGAQPMFRFAKSNSRQWEVSPVIHEELDMLECHEIERAVSMLPDKHRDAIRYVYVYPQIHINKILRELAVRPDTLQRLIIDARDMLNNRLQMRLANTE